MKQLILLAILISLTYTLKSQTCQVSVVGGGFSGLYTTWRLANAQDSSILPNDICLFEALDRFGGRIYTVTNAELQELNNYVLEGGLYRFHSVYNLIFKTLVEDVFNIPTECYFNTSMDTTTPSIPLRDKVNFNLLEEKLAATTPISTLGKDTLQSAKGSPIEGAKGIKLEGGKFGGIKLEGAKESKIEDGKIEDDKFEGVKGVKLEGVKGVKLEGVKGVKLEGVKGVNIEGVRPIDQEELANFINSFETDQSELFPTTSKSNCKVDNHILFLRNMYFTSNDITTSANIPYFLRNIESWNASLPTFILTKYITLLNTVTNGIVNVNTLMDLRSTGSLIDYVQKLKPMFKDLLQVTFKEVPLHAVDAKTVIVDHFGFTSEFCAAMTDILGSPDTILSTNMLEFIMHSVAKLTLIDKGTFRKIKIGEGRKGFTTLIDAMLQQIINKGVKVFNGRKVVNILRGVNTEKVSESEKLVLRFEKHQDVITDRVILTMGSFQLKKISTTSVLYSNKSSPFLNMLGNLKDVGAHKLFLYYDNAFWKSFSSSVLTTSEWIRKIRYFEGPIICPSTTGLLRPSFKSDTLPSKVVPTKLAPEAIPRPIDIPRDNVNPSGKIPTDTERNLRIDECPGFLELSYVVGDPISSLNVDVMDMNDFVGSSSVLTIIRDTSKRGALYLNKLSDIVEKLHKPILENVTIPKPRMAVLFNWEKDDWFKAGVVHLPTNIDIKTAVKIAMRPIDGINVHLVNPDFMGSYTWETGFDSAVVLAEKVLGKYMGIGKPNWMSSSVYSLMVPKRKALKVVS